MSTRHLTAETRTRDLRGPRSLLASEPSTIQWVVLAIGLSVAGLGLLYLTRGTALWSDEWTWAQNRRGSSLTTFLAPHNQHLSLIPIAIYRLLFATAGLKDYLPYRMVGIAAHLLCCAVIFVYARRRVGGLIAFLMSGLILFLGPAWQDIIWPFQVAWFISIAAGVGALLVLDRGDRVGDVWASVMLAVSIASSGIGVAFLLGGAVDVMLRRRRADLWIAAVPAVLYGLWALKYQDSQFLRHQIPLTIYAAPSWAAGAASAAMSALFGLSGPTQPADGSALQWGRPLLAIAVALLATRAARVKALPSRAYSLLAICLSFWILTALSRDDLEPPFEGRYVYVGAVVIVLLGAEVARGINLRPRVGWLLGAAVVAISIANIGALRDSATFLRAQAQVTRADLGALEIGRAYIGPAYSAQHFPGGIFIPLAAGPYFAAARAYGTPADSPAQISAEPETPRATADAELISVHRIALEPNSGGVNARNRPPVVEAVTGATARGAGSCVEVTPAGFQPAVAVVLQVTMPASGVELKNRSGGAASVSVRRFGSEFRLVGAMRNASTARLLIGADSAPQPWHLQLTAAGPATICSI